MEGVGPTRIDEIIIYRPELLCLRDEHHTCRCHPPLVHSSSLKLVYRGYSDVNRWPYKNSVPLRDPSFYTSIYLVLKV